MKNAQAWADKFANFSENYQLEIAELIIDELSFNERMGDESYDKDKSHNVRRVLSNLRIYLKQELEVAEVDELFARISTLSDENKAKLSKAIMSSLNKYFGIQEQEEKEAVCQREGHDFGEWVFHEWTSYERVCIDHQIVDNYPIPHKEWTRKCNRCGFEEKVKTEPEEVRTARIKRERKEEAKALRKRLRELEGKD